LEPCGSADTTITAIGAIAAVATIATSRSRTVGRAAIAAGTTIVACSAVSLGSAREPKSTKAGETGVSTAAAITC
jgi:hypothetical protein